MNFSLNVSPSASFAITVLSFSISLVYASTFIDKLQSDFDKGTYNNTLYNTSVGAVSLNLSYNNGTYTSQIFYTGSNVSLNNLSWTYQRIQCPANMSYINKLNGYCIDQYEASPLNADGSYNTSQFLYNSSTFSTNLLNAGGKAGSASNRTVWVYINQTDARRACNNSGKHLCTDAEWLGAANINGSFYNLPTNLNIAPYYCVTDSGTYCTTGNSPGSGNACNTGMNKTGGVSGCKSSEGVYDMTGNVWEWTNATVDVINPLGNSTTGTGTANWYYFNGTGWATGTGTATKKYGDDGVYFPTSIPGNAVLRGGSWTYGAIYGPFSANLDLAPSRTSSTVGFRCCSS